LATNLRLLHGRCGVSELSPTLFGNSDAISMAAAGDEFAFASWPLQSFLIATDPVWESRHLLDGRGWRRNCYPALSISGEDEYATPLSFFLHSSTDVTLRITASSNAIAF